MISQPISLYPVNHGETRMKFGYLSDPIFNKLILKLKYVISHKRKTQMILHDLADGDYQALKRYDRYDNFLRIYKLTVPRNDYHSKATSTLYMIRLLSYISIMLLQTNICNKREIELMTYNMEYHSSKSIYDFTYTDLRSNPKTLKYNSAGWI